MTSLEHFERAMRELRFDADLYVDDEGRIKVHILRQGNTYALVDRKPAWLTDGEAVSVAKALYRLGCDGTAPDVRPWTLARGIGRALP